MSALKELLELNQSRAKIMKITGRHRWLKKIESPFPILQEEWYCLEDGATTWQDVGITYEEDFQ